MSSIAIKKVAPALVQIITAPFSAPILPKTLALAALIGLYQVISWTAQHTFYPFSVLIFLWCYKTAEGVLFGWFLMLPYKHIGKLKLAYYWIILILFAFFTLFDVFFLAQYNHPFIIIFADVLAATNPKEATEFLQTFVNLKIVSLFFLALLIPTAIYLITTLTTRNKHIKIKYLLYTIAVVLLTYSACFKIKPKICIEFGCIPVIIYHASNSIEKIGSPIELTNPDITLTAPANYDNICIIIGESLCRNHMSIYGYLVPTSPNLMALKEKGDLYSFSSISSPHVYTDKVFRELLSLAHTGDSAWNKRTTLIEVAQKGNHKVTWLSNQSKKALWQENIQTTISSVCDTAIFTIPEESRGLFKVEYDELLFPLFDSELAKNSKSTKKNLYIFQLMGNHTVYADRFPKNFTKFKEDLYRQYPKEQRQTRADYDNSVLYNDFIVSQLIHRFSGTKSIVIYLSDHALDFYSTDPTYNGHAKPNDPRSYATAIDIPFIIYMTPEYQAANPQVVEAVKQHLNTPFNTTDLTYTVMDIMGVNFTDTIANGSTATRSLLRLD